MRIATRLLQILLPLGILALAGFATMTMINSRPPVETQSPRISPPGVRVHVVRLEDTELSVLSEGTVQPRTESQLVPEIAGRITSIAPSFAEGGFFEADDVLVTIDPFDYRQAVISARSQLAQTRLRLAQEEAEAEVAQREWDELGQGDPRELTLRKPQLEDARAAVAAAEANLVRTERDLERAEIRAPYAGRVRRKSVDVGQFVTVGNPIATIYAVDVAEIRLPLPDEDLAYLDLPLSYRGQANSRGPQVTVSTTFAGETYAWAGSIVRTESEIDPVSRMVNVIAEIRDPYGIGSDPNRPPLAVGMYVDAQIAGRRFSQIAAIPRSALRGRNQVMVIDEESRLHFRDVDILRMTTESLFIEAGLETGDQVAISTLDSPTDGMQVQVSEIIDLQDTLEQQLVETEVLDSISSQRVAQESPTWLQAEIKRNSETEIESTDEQQATPALNVPAVVLTSNLPEEDAETAPERHETVAPPKGETTATVLPFTNLSQQTETIRLGETLAQLVSEQLANLETLTIVPDTTTAQWVIGGAVQQEGKRLKITSRIVESEESRTIDVIKVDGHLDRLSNVKEKVAETVRRSLQAILKVRTVNESQKVEPAMRPPAFSPLETPDTPTSAGSTILIRPFINLTENPEDTLLAEGIHETLATQIALNETSALVDDPITATFVITGGIQRVGETIRVTARVVRQKDGVVVSSAKLDGSTINIEQLQEQMVSTIYSDLEVAAAAITSE